MTVCNGSVLGAFPLRRVLRRVGRRGASLGFVGLLCLAVAGSLLFAPPGLAATPAYTVLTVIAPLPVWALAWYATGALCLLQMFARSDRVAFAAATALLLLYGLIHLISTFTGDNPLGWVGGAVWLAFGGWIALIATWPECAHQPDLLPGAPPLNAAVVVADAAGVIQSWTPQAAAMFGWSPEEAVGRPLTMLMPPRLRGPHAAALARVRSSGHSELTGRLIPLVAMRRDGSEFPIALTVNAWHGDDGVTYTGVIQPMGAGNAVE